MCLTKCIRENCRADIALLATIFLAILCQSLLFLFDVACSPYPLWASFAAVTAVLAIYSRKSLLCFWGWAFACAVITAYMFPCVGWDVGYYHFPMQMLLRDGWNPVYCSVIEQFDDSFGMMRFGKVHTLFLPHINALSGALVGHALGLQTGCALLNLVYAIVLARVSYDLAREAWSCSRSSAACFSLCIVAQAKLSSTVAGMVDYLTFASLSVALFSALLWHLRRTWPDLTLLVMSMVICSLSKTTGLVSCVVIGGILLLLNPRVKSVWTAGGVVASLILVMGVHPLLTSWYQYGCPLYPTVTWSPDVPVLQITDDFVENADAQRMGYLPRVVYAWISDELAMRYCAWRYAAPTFDPVFSLKQGYGAAFRCLMVASLAITMCVRRNHMTGMIALIFILSNLCPLKYIGYSRYCPQICLIPILSAFHFMYSDGWVRKRCPRVAWTCMTSIVLSGFLLFAVAAILRTGAAIGRGWALERIRQGEFERLRDGTSAVTLPDSPLQFTLLKSLRHAGVAVAASVNEPPGWGGSWQDYSFRADRAGCARSELVEVNERGEPVFYFYWELLLASNRRLADVIREFNRRHPACDGPAELLRYRWKEAFFPPPRPRTESIRF